MCIYYIFKEAICIPIHIRIYLCTYTPPPIYICTHVHNRPVYTYSHVSVGEPAHAYICLDYIYKCTYGMHVYIYTIYTNTCISMSFPLNTGICIFIDIKMYKYLCIYTNVRMRL